MLSEAQIANDLGIQQADRIARGGVAEPRMKLFGDGGTADDSAPLEHADREPRARKIRSASQAVVAATEYDDIEAPRCGHECVPGARRRGDAPLLFVESRRDDRIAAVDVGDVASDS